MSTRHDWVIAFARQATADLSAWKQYQVHAQPIAAQCHALLFLQMACEKLCKAHLIRHSTDVTKLQSSHGYVAEPLPLIIRHEMSLSGGDPKRLRGAMPKIRGIACEIELLNPAVRRDGKREDNCEYPWQDGPNVISPLDYSFSVSHLIVAPAGRTFLKLLESAIQRNLPE